ncbi:MAG: hypothetical protein EA368_16275 [Leptolyngbya sp. DLM2.Bin27]|nr:MAG: hypothetical protein EA368_16275 [Leptolyngbya sp. DLM2.Bin27]
MRGDAVQGIRFKVCCKRFTANPTPNFSPNKSPPAQALEGQEFLKIVTKSMICAQGESAQRGLTHQVAF